MRKKKTFIEYIFIQIKKERKTLMTPEIITYLICLLTFAYLAVTVFTFVKNRRTGDGYRLRIFYVLAAALVFLLSVYAIATGQTYDDLVTSINDLFQ